MTNYITDADTRMGTIGGTLLVMLANINAGQLFNTVVMATTGAVVSFAVSLSCKYVSERMKRRKGRVVDEG